MTLIAVFKIEIKDTGKLDDHALMRVSYSLDSLKLESQISQLIHSQIHSIDAKSDAEINITLTELLS